MILLDKNHRGISFAFFMLTKILAAASPFKSTIVNLRDVGPSFITEDINDSTPTWCHLQIDRSIVFGHPMSINKDDRYYGVGSTMLHAMTMTVDYINTERCGVHVAGKNYSIALQTIGDNSNADKHTAIGKYLVNRTDFMLAGYSSSLTEQLSLIAEENSRVMVAGGSAQSSVFSDREHAFGILPRSDTYLDQALAAVARRGAKKLAYFVEDGFALCESFPGVDKYQLELLPRLGVRAQPNMTDFDPIVEQMEEWGPDVVLSCAYPQACGNWIKAMRKHNWTPKALIFVVCFGASELEDAAGTDLAYMMGAASWNRKLPPIPDAVTGWTPGQFADMFEEYAYVNATYQNAAAAASVSVLVQAIEKAGTLETDAVRNEIAVNTFNTMYGETRFNGDGQNSVLSLLFQYDKTGEVHAVYPPEKASTDFQLVYPLPTWESRDCMLQSSCETLGGMCLQDGTCDCKHLEDFIPFGRAANATCKNVPTEDLGYIADIWISIGYAGVAFQALLSSLAIVWTFCYRAERIVKAAQPFFLILIALGCAVLSSAIIPAGFEGAYRVERNETTGLLTDTANQDVSKVDAACMAVPWLASLGFAIIFSALFAKILRVKKVMKNAAECNRKVVGIKDVIIIMVVMILAEATILMSWQLVGPLRWEREILMVDHDGFTLASVGSCESDWSTEFATPLAIINGASLVYALWLCFVTRSAPSEFAEGKWITIAIVSIFQILILAVPVLVIANDDRTASFFVKAGFVTLLSSGVTLLIFVPKIWRLFHDEKVGKSSGGTEIGHCVENSDIVWRLPHSSDGVEQAVSEKRKQSLSTKQGTKQATPPMKDDVLVGQQSHGWGALTIGNLPSSVEERDEE